MVLGTWSRKDRLYDGTYSLESNGELAEQLQEAITRLPESVFACQAESHICKRQPLTPLPPLERHITEGSFFIADDTHHHAGPARPGRSRHPW